MLKLLILFPLMLVGGAIGLAAVVPLLALLPFALAIGAGMIALFAIVGVFGLLMRLFAGLVLGIGAVLVGALGFGFLFAGGAIFVLFGVALTHLLMPLLILVALFWIIRRASRPAPALPAPHA